MHDTTQPAGNGRHDAGATPALKSEEHVRRLLDHMPAGAYTCDADGLITYYNEPAAKLWGRAPRTNDPVDRFCGSFRLFRSDGAPIKHNECWMALALHNAQGYNGEEIVVERPNGERLTVLAHANPILDEDGRLVGAVNVLVDITHRKKTETELHDRLRQLRLVHDLSTKVTRADSIDEIYDTALDAILDAARADRAAVLLFDADDVMRFKAWRGLSDPYRLAVEGHSPWRRDETDAAPIVVSDAESDSSLADFRETIVGEGIRALAFVPLVGEYGLIGKFMLYSNAPRTFSESQLQLAQTIANHVAFAIERRRSDEALAASERKYRALTETLEQRVTERTHELARANNLLAQRNRELQDFAYVASHDLQEPLRKFRTFLDLLEVELDGPSIQVLDYICRMNASAERMSELITALLTLSRVSIRGERYQTTDLGQIIHEVLTDLEVQSREAGAKIEVGPLCTVQADPLQIRQLFQNLISNALKFRRPDVAPVLQIQARTDRSSADHPVCRMTVSDNGIGFDEKYASRIFAPFQRLHERGEYPGTGMGLAICRRIVERHGGEISVRSAPSAGTTFTITLPLRQRTLNLEEALVT